MFIFLTNFRIPMLEVEINSQNTRTIDLICSVYSHSFHKCIKNY